MYVFCVRSRRSSGKSTGSGKLAWLSVADVQPMSGLVELGPPSVCPDSPTYVWFIYYNIVCIIITTTI